MQCASCGHDLPAKNRFCQYFGKKIPKAPMPHKAIWLSCISIFLGLACITGSAIYVHTLRQQMTHLEQQIAELKADNDSLQKDLAWERVSDAMNPKWKSEFFRSGAYKQAGGASD